MVIDIEYHATFIAVILFYSKVTPNGCSNYFDVRTVTDHWHQMGFFLVNLINLRNTHEKCLHRASRN